MQGKPQPEPQVHRGIFFGREGMKIRNGIFNSVWGRLYAWGGWSPLMNLAEKFENFLSIRTPTHFYLETSQLPRGNWRFWILNPLEFPQLESFELLNDKLKLLKLETHNHFQYHLQTCVVKKMQGEPKTASKHCLQSGFESNHGIFSLFGFKRQIQREKQSGCLHSSLFNGEKINKIQEFP